MGRVTCRNLAFEENINVSSSVIGRRFYSKFRKNLRAAFECRSCIQDCKTRSNSSHDFDLRVHWVWLSYAVRYLLPDFDANVPLLRGRLPGSPMSSKSLKKAYGKSRGLFLERLEQYGHEMHICKEGDLTITEVCLDIHISSIIRAYSTYSISSSPGAPSYLMFPVSLGLHNINNNYSRMCATTAGFHIPNASYREFNDCMRAYERV